MRNYISIKDVLARDPKWADRVRTQANVKRRRERADPKNRARLMWQGIRGEAKRKGVSCDLTLAWFESRLKIGLCEMSGLPFDLERSGRRTAAPNTPSVDRRVAGGNYTEANCRMILFSINRALSDCGEEYMLNVFQHVLARRGA